ncbi:MAG TPA: ABC-type transport auxiliary lipoprotein family protein [Rhodanobacteraceae bacterium]
MIRTAFVLLIAVLLAGCAHTPSRQVFPRHYTLTVSPLNAPSTGIHVHATLQVGRISVPPWLDGSDLYYRLDYRHDDQIAAYGQSDWIAPPARLLEQAVVTVMGTSGAWRIVTGPASAARSDFSLDIRLNDFSQVFTSPVASKGVLDATATLLDNQTDQAVAQRHFHIQAPSPSPDAAGGARALNAASQQFVAQLRQWLATARPPLPSPEP